MLGVWRGRGGRGFCDAQFGSRLAGAVVLQGGRRGLAAQVEKAGLLLVLLVAGVAQEHELGVVLPLWEVEVLRAACFVGAHCLVFALEDGSQIPELCLYVFH